MVSAKISKEVRKEVYKRDGYLCALCGSGQYLQIHHVVPRSQGGSDFPENLITLCSKCHGQAHGIDCIPGYIDQQSVNDACLEYVADFYAPDWYPYK